MNLASVSYSDGTARSNANEVEPDMLDIIIKGGSVIDGAGSPPRLADVGIKGDRIVAVGRIDEAAAKVVDASGKVVVPGFVDPHTHYDAQLFWDSYATPSSLHGVTTVIAGNCGFTLAPLEAKDADFLRRMMAQVEGMPLEALEAGLPWDWRTFGDFLGKFEGRVGVNAAFMVGHSALRKFVMGDAATGQKATPAQVEQMVALLHQSLDAGGLGFSTSLSFTHIDGDGQPVPSRFADWSDEVLKLCRAVRDHPGTTLEFIVDGCVGKFSEAEIELMTNMSLEAQRPLNWNVLQVSAANRAGYEHQLNASRRAAERGARVVALAMPVNVHNTMSFLTHCALHLLPDWGQILRLPVPARIEALKSQDVRARMMASAQSPAAGNLSGLTNWSRYSIGATFSAQNEGLAGRNIGELAQERGQTPTDCIFDIVIADDLKTVLWPNSGDDSAESWALRAEAWSDEHVMLGGSDAGAHLDRMCGASYPTAFLADCLRGRKLMPTERAVQLMTQTPARHFGLTDRGEIRVGWKADVVVIDPDRVGAGPVVRADDLPGDSWRLTSVADGVEHVFVNGQEIVRDGELTSALPGQVLRSGQDTYTAPIQAPA
jgi:N-acyl-D-aspartate/D-glutamate deacylase